MPRILIIYKIELKIFAPKINSKILIVKRFTNLKNFYHDETLFKPKLLLQICKKRRAEMKHLKDSAATPEPLSSRERNVKVAIDG